MLSYSIDEQGNFVVTESIFGFATTKVTEIRHSPDLTKCQVGVNNPWQENDEKGRAWFEKYHRKNFDALQEKTEPVQEPFA